MKIVSTSTSIDYYGFSCSLPWYGKSLSGKHRLKLELREAAGMQGIGEFAIPDFESTDSLRKIQTLVENATKSIINRDISDQNICITKPGLGLEGFVSDEWGVAWLLEHALFDLAHKRQAIDGIPRHLRTRFLPLSLNGEVAVQGSHIKLKVTEDGSKTVNTIKRMMEKSHHPLKFRLDGNRGLSVATLRRLEENLGNVDIEFFEEPCLHSAQLTSRFELACDESFEESISTTIDSADSAIQTAMNFQWIVVKATKIFSPSLAFYVLEKLKGLGKKIVLSSAHDTPGSFPLLLAMAEFLDSEEVHGMGSILFCPSLIEGLAIEGDQICYRLKV